MIFSLFCESFRISRHFSHNPITITAPTFSPSSHAGARIRIQISTFSATAITAIIQNKPFHRDLANTVGFKMKFVPEL